MSAPASSPTPVPKENMKKPFTRQRAFSTRSSAKATPTRSWQNAGLPLEYLDGVSCFETLRSYSGKIFRLEDHLERLAASCRGVRRALPVSTRELKAWVEKSLCESGAPEALLRLSVHWDGSGSGRLVILIREFRGHPARGGGKRGARGL